MALFDNTWYVSSVGWIAVTAWSTGTAIAAGDMRRQLSSSVGNERVFFATIAGTTHATTEPTWTVTRGAITTDNTVTWQEVTGSSAVNGDVTNTPASSSVRSLAITLGAIIKNNAATHYFICSVAGTAGAGEPTYNTASIGQTTTDSGVTWRNLGPVGNFTGGQAPHARLTNALATNWGALNNTIFIKSDHAETRAATMTILGTNSAANPQFCFCHNGSAYPPLSANLTTGATLITTAGNGIDITAVGIYFEGLTFQCGSGAVNTGMTFGGAAGWQVFKNCSLQKLGTTGSGAAISAVSDCYVEFINTTVKFGATSDSIRSRRSRIIWRDTPGILAGGSSVPASLWNALDTGFVYTRNCDLSLIAGTLVAANIEGNFVFEDCKLHASVTHTGAMLGPNNQNVDVIRCASGATNYDVFRYRYQGTESTETTIVRTGGASDGTTTLARKIVTTSGAKFLNPFESTPIVVWNDSTTSKTLTVYGIWGGGAVPDNDDIWIEVEYLGSSASPLASRISSGKADHLATASALSSDGSTWGGSTTAFSTSVTFTPQMKGPIYCYVKAGAASTTFYFDPKVLIA